MTRLVSLGSCLLLVVSFAACSDPVDTGDGFDAGDSYRSTIPLFGEPITWLPTNGLGDETASALAAEATRTDLTLVAPSDLPASLPQDAEASLSTQGSGTPGGSGQYFGSFLDVSTASSGQLVRVASPPDEWCPPQATAAVIRGSDGCWYQRDDAVVVWWAEQSAEFGATVAGGLAADEVLTWIETWRVFPESGR